MAQEARSRQTRSQTSTLKDNAKNCLLLSEVPALPELSHFVVTLLATATRWRAVFKYAEKLISGPKSESRWARETDTSYGFRSD